MIVPLLSSLQPGVVKTGLKHQVISPHTVDFARQMEAAGASFITVHGRTQDQRSDPVCLDAIADIKNAVKIPVVANGEERNDITVL